MKFQKIHINSFKINKKDIKSWWKNILAYNSPFGYIEYKKKYQKTYFFKVKFEKKMKFYWYLTISLNSDLSNQK